MEWNNQVELTVHDDLVEAQRVIHTLIAAGIEANVAPRYSVTVPKGQERVAQNALYLALEVRGKKEVPNAR